MSNETQGKCPVMHGAAATNSSENSTSVRDWWPNNLNLNIFGADMNVISKGLTQVEKSFILPPATSDDYIDQLLKVCKENQVKVLFHGSEPELLKMNENRSLIEKEGIFLPINSDRVLKICMDKYLTIDFLKNNNFCFPKNL